MRNCTFVPFFTCTGVGVKLYFFAVMSITCTFWPDACCRAGLTLENEPLAIHPAVIRSKNARKNIFNGRLPFIFLICRLCVRCPITLVHARNFPLLPRSLVIHPRLKYWTQQPPFRRIRSPFPLPVPCISHLASRLRNGYYNSATLNLDCIRKPLPAK